jgi:IS5 family transposase
MRPKKHETTGSGDLFRARGSDHQHEARAGAARRQDRLGYFIDGEIAPLYSDSGRPGIATLLKHICGLVRRRGCERWVYDPYFQHFTGEEFFQHEFAHERAPTGGGLSCDHAACVAAPKSADIRGAPIGLLRVDHHLRKETPL